MSLFKPGEAAPTKPRKGPPPAREKPRPRAMQPKFDPAPPLTRVKVGDVCYLKARVVQPVMEFMGPGMKETAAVWVEFMDGDAPGMDGRSDGVLERWLITREQIVAEVRHAIERGAT